MTMFKQRLMHTCAQYAEVYISKLWGRQLEEDETLCTHVLYCRYSALLVVVEALINKHLHWNTTPCNRSYTSIILLLVLLVSVEG